MTTNEALRFIERHGVVLEAAYCSVPSLAGEALGLRAAGSWWGHPRGKEFFWLTRHVRENSAVLVCRLIDEKITYVHRRLWPALVRLSRDIGSSRLAAVHEAHTTLGKHEVTITHYPKWVPADVLAAGRALKRVEAAAALDAAVPIRALIPAASRRTPRATPARAGRRARTVRPTRSRR